LAQAFGYSVVAEGVESEEHGRVLLQLGCTKAQGYAIAKAMPGSEVLGWLNQWKGYPQWQSVQPVDAAERTLLYATIEHRSWVNAIKSYLLGESTGLPALNASQCHLGLWMEQYATPQQRNHPEFGHLKQLHEQLHRLASELLSSKASGQAESIEKLNQYRQDIIQRLETLLRVA